VVSHHHFLLCLFDVVLAPAAHTALLAPFGTAARLDEGLLSFSLSILLYMVNPHSYKKCQWRITARPRISAQEMRSVVLDFSMWLPEGGAPTAALLFVVDLLLLPCHLSSYFRGQFRA
jgi:hypothetical protein